MPALVKSSVGSLAGTSDDECTRRWPLLSKKRRNLSRISEPVSIRIYCIEGGPRYCAGRMKGSGQTDVGRSKLSLHNGFREQDSAPLLTCAGIPEACRLLATTLYIFFHMPEHQVAAASLPAATGRNKPSHF